ncbi:12894_t:CDS:1, partial [Cetraspora pellucida]
YHDRMSHKIVSKTPEKCHKRLNHEQQQHYHSQVAPISDISNKRACNAESSRQAEFRAREATRN